MTATAPEPPNPDDLVRQAQEGQRRIQDRLLEESIALHPAWEHFGDPGVEDVAETLRYFGLDPQEGAYTPGAGRSVFGAVFSEGDYEAVPIFDEEGNLTPEGESRSQFYMSESGQYLRDYRPSATSQSAAREMFDEALGGTRFDDRMEWKDPRNKMVVSSAQTRDPAPITYSPTASINPSRPRTVAAGYDIRRQVLTVVFRDGTLYNYYGVGPGEWSNFRKSHSPGRFINRNLNAKGRGYADMTDIPQVHRDLMYKAARTAQHAQKGRTGWTSKTGRRYQQSYKSRRDYLARYAKANPKAPKYKAL